MSDTVLKYLTNDELSALAKIIAEPANTLDMQSNGLICIKFSKGILCLAGDKNDALATTAEYLQKELKRRRENPKTATGE